jgi:aspartate racemase
MKIGVLGGIGPESTAVFYSRLISKLQEKGLIKFNRDFPQIIINSIPAKELIHSELKESEIDEYLKGLKELDTHSPDFIVMVCNTVHYFYDYLQSNINTKMIDLRKEVRKFIESSRTKNYCVLGTETTIKNLYGGTIEVGAKDIDLIKNAIYNYNKGIKKVIIRNQIQNLCEKYHKLGADKIILGCTELATMVNFDYTIDTINILVNSTIEYLSLNKNKPF